MPVYRSRTTTQGRNMAGARALLPATGRFEDFMHLASNTAIAPGGRY